MRVAALRRSPQARSASKAPPGAARQSLQLTERQKKRGCNRASVQVQWSGNNRKILIRYELYPAIHPISLYACQFKIRNPTDQHIYPGNSS